MGRTFLGFLNTERARNGRDAEFLDRLTRSAGDIRSLPDLMRWACERYPREFDADAHQDAALPHGRGAMQKLWTEYLDYRRKART